jgi:YVTN family beta-propeller protein
MRQLLTRGFVALSLIIASCSALAQQVQHQAIALCQQAASTGGPIPIALDCPQVCGGIIGATCDDGEFCEFPVGTCDVSDRQGVCVEIPVACPDNVDPVCGCDGITYGNDCEADTVGVSIDHVGPCGKTFVNWENGHVHPLELTPDGTRLLAVNTADNRLEVFDASGATPTHIGSVPVGLDPVSVRSFGNSTAWVVNHISDSISVVDLNTLNVVATIETEDEPADVVFVGEPRRAFVSCSQANVVEVFDLGNLSAPAATIPIEGEDPRAMAFSADRNTVYVSIFESGNATTVLAGNEFLNLPQPMQNTNGPYGGVNPPPNNGSEFDPPLTLCDPMPPGCFANPPPDCVCTPPLVSLIVRKDAAGNWLDDNAANWTDFVSGPNADVSGRPVGWDMPDHDVAVIDVNTLNVSYISGLMNINMAMAVHPTSGEVTVVGTEATNDIRFEPVVNGRFLRVNVAIADPSGINAPSIVDLNSHLTYANTSSFSPVPQPQRDLSVGDPRAIVWGSGGNRGYVAAMGSDNLLVIDGAGNRIQPLSAPNVRPIELDGGPTGLAIDRGRNVLFILNKFAATVQTVDLTTEIVIDSVPLFDPTPSTIRVGRKHLYDTHKNSGLGHVSCGSCHIDGRTDRLAWDLGDPSGEMRPFDQNCGNIEGANCPSWHPMKGPMVTQTLQDIIGKEPHHWRGDRTGIEEFNGAFRSLLGDDDDLDPQEMQEFENFLATIVIPPNPNRELDNSLPAFLPLDGHFSTGRFSPAGTPLPPGNALAGLDNYRFGQLDGVNCVSCHTLPTGISSNLVVGTNGTIFEFPTGPDGEFHHGIIRADGSDQRNFKVAQLRTMLEKTGFDQTQLSNNRGFGFLHDGTVDSITRFISLPAFGVANDQEIADLVAFMLSFGGSDLPLGNTTDPLELLGPTSNDTHSAVGVQVTFDATNQNDPALVNLLNQMIALADAGAVGVVVKGKQSDIQRGYKYVGGQTLQSDRMSEQVSVTALRLSTAAGNEITFTVTPAGSEHRIGVDRDQDGFFDRDELDACSNPADSASTPSSVAGTADFDGDGDVDLDDYEPFAACITGPCASDTCAAPLYESACCAIADLDFDNDVDATDYAILQSALGGP